VEKKKADKKDQRRVLAIQKVPPLLREEKDIRKKSLECGNDGSEEWLVQEIELERLRLHGIIWKKT